MADRFSSVRKIALYAVGLINGSLGLALRKAGYNGEIVGVGRRAETLERALSKGAVDRYALETQIGDALDGADIAVSGTLPHLIVDSIALLRRSAPDAAAFTDVGSVKAEIARGCGEIVPNGRFVGGHPIAGSHLTGVEHADADLFQGRVCVLTPSAETDPDAAALVRAMWERVGMRVIEAPPTAHDALLAASSHLPHVAASALAAAVGSVSVGGLDADSLVGGGYMDATRIAQGSAELWEPILRMNAKPVERVIRRYIDALSAFADALAAQDGAEIRALLEEGRRARDGR